MKQFVSNSMRVLIVGVVLAVTSVALPVTALTDEERADQIERIEAQAQEFKLGDVTGPTLDELAITYGVTRANTNEELGEFLLEKIYSEAGAMDVLNASLEKDALIFFIAYDIGEAAHLGGGERAGVIDSWREAQQAYLPGVYVPTTAGHWEDILKIANGRWPSYIIQSSVEEAQYDMFEQVYKRQPNRANVNDNAAIMVMTYGMRATERNMVSEGVAIGFFYSIFQRNPSTAFDWNIVRAIAYSGAIR